MIQAVTMWYGAVNMIARGIEAAQSLDTAKIVQAIRAPGFTWEGWGFTASLGGEQTSGMKSYCPIILGFSEVRDGELHTMSYKIVSDP